MWHGEKVPFCSCTAVTLLVVLSLLLLGNQAGYALTEEQKLYLNLHADAFRGLAGIEVAIEYLSPEVVHAGLTQEYLQALVEKQLRQAGIRVLGHSATRPEDPYLYVSLQTGKSTSSGLTPFMCRVELQQVVVLPASKTASPMPVTTWHSTGFLGAAPTSEIKKLYACVMLEVAQFTEAYIAVNPR